MTDTRENSFRGTIPHPHAMSDQDTNQPTPPSPEGSTPSSEVPNPPITTRVRTKTEQVPTKTSRISLSGKPETKTSQIPLRKETVRITLKATPESRGEPAEPKPLSAPSLQATGPVGVARPVVPPAATTPLKVTAPPPAPPAPPKAPGPVGTAAPTIPLRKPSAGPAAPGVAPTTPIRPAVPTASPTIPLRPGAAPTAVPGAAAPMPSATQALGAPPPPNLVPASVGTRAPVDSDDEPSDKVNIILAALLLITTILLGLIEYSKSRVSEVQDISAVKADAPFTDLLGQ